MIQQFHFLVYIQKKWKKDIESVCTILCLLYRIIHNSQHMETTQVSFSEEMGKEDVIDTYLYNGIVFGHEREGNPAICDNMDGTWGHYAKWDKPERAYHI